MLNSPTFAPFPHRRSTSLILILIMSGALILLTVLPLQQVTPANLNLDNHSLHDGLQPQTAVSNPVSSPQIGPSSAPSTLLSAQEVVDRRDAYSRHFDLGNGRFLALASPTPLNYLDDQGTWQPIQAAFQTTESGYAVRENSLQSFLQQDRTTLSLESHGTLFVWQSKALAARGEKTVTVATPLPPERTSPPETDVSNTTLTYAQAWSLAGMTEQFRSGPGTLQQELILDAPPTAVSGADWFELRVLLATPPDTKFLADGQLQAGEFVTAGPIELRTPDGTLLLELAPPVAYEQAQPDVSIAGRYHLIPQALGVELRIQTPYAWWTAPDRRYPAVFNPTMQVIQDLEGATISTREILSGLGHPTRSPAFASPPALATLSPMKISFVAIAAATCAFPYHRCPLARSPAPPRLLPYQTPDGAQTRHILTTMTALPDSQLLYIK